MFQVLDNIDVIDKYCQPTRILLSKEKIIQHKLSPQSTRKPFKIRFKHDSKSKGIKLILHKIDSQTKIQNQIRNPINNRNNVITRRIDKENNVRISKRIKKKETSLAHSIIRNQMDRQFISSRKEFINKKRTST